MIDRPVVKLAGFATAAVLAIAACGSSATQAPASSAPSSAASTAASPSAASIPSFAIPSSVASALASLGTVPDASTLLTADMAASVIGGSPTKVTPPINVPGMSIAAYGTGGGDTVSIYVQAVPGGVANAQLQAAIAMAGQQGSLQPVSGLGDAAGKTVSGNSATVAFVKGGALVVVTGDSSSSTGADLEPKVEAVAQQIVSKL